MNSEKIRKQVRRTVIGILNRPSILCELYDRFEKEDTPEVCRAVREIRRYLRDGVNGVTIDQDFGTIEAGSTVVGVKIGRLG